MGEPWFRVEGTGLAAKPINGKGWAVTIGFVLAVIIWAVVVFAVLEPTPTNVIIFILGALAMALVLAFIALNKSEGRWAWQRKTPSGQE